MLYKILKIMLLLILINLSTCTTCKGNAIQKDYKKTIAIDLDGVLNEYDGKFDKNNIPKIKHGAKDFIAELSKDYTLILFTNRKPILATKWLIDNKIDKYFSDITNIKPLASVYLDDRALKFENDYNKTLGEIKNFEVHWMR